MVDTPSNMMPLGTPMPEFALTDTVTGRLVNTRELETRKGFLVLFICNHCPFVIHIRQQLVQAAHEALDLDLHVIAINSNSAVSHPQDGPTHMKALAQSEHWRFPFVFDESQAVAKEFRAACTPDIFLFDRNRRLAYRGQFDDSRPSNGKPVTGADLRTAIKTLASGLPVPTDQKPSIGCSIKWEQPTR
jgi:thiol-disulfide isomerase/thioredoxin